MTGQIVFDACAGVIQKSLQCIVIRKSVLADSTNATHIVIGDRKYMTVGHARNELCGVYMFAEPPLAGRNSVAVYEECHFIDGPRPYLHCSTLARGFFLASGFLLARTNQFFGQKIVDVEQEANLVMVVAQLRGFTAVDDSGLLGSRDLLA